MTNNPTKYEQILSYDVMTNNPTKYEQILSYSFKGVTFTNYHGRTDGRRLLLCHSITQPLGDKKHYKYISC